MLTTSTRQRRCEAVRSTPSCISISDKHSIRRKKHPDSASSSPEMHESIIFFEKALRGVCKTANERYRKECFSGLFSERTAGTLTSFVPLPINYTYLLLPLFLIEKVKGAQIFPAVILGASRFLGTNKILIRIKKFFSAGKGVTGANVSPTAQGNDPLGNPHFAGA